MTSAPDGDVERALAAMGATPLKYYSFGVAAVRPPGSDHAMPPVSALPNGLPPSGEGTIEQYRAHAVSTVFPLLGLALPEAFHIDVEPVWPVGPPVSDQGILLDRNGNIASSFAGLSHPAFFKEPPSTTSNYPRTYSSIGDGAADTPSTSVPFVMPAWLDPTRSADFGVAPGPAPSASPANLFSWFDTLSSAPSPIAPPERPITHPDHGSGDARPPLGTVSQSPEPQNREAFAPISFSPFAKAADQPDPRPSAEAAVPPSVQMSPHWLDTIKQSETPEHEVKLTDWSVLARDERVQEHLSPAEPTIPSPATLTNHQAASPFVIHPTPLEQLYASAAPAEWKLDDYELRPLAERATPTWHEPPSNEPSEPAIAPLQGALGNGPSTSEPAATSRSEMPPSAGISAGAETWQGGYQWSASNPPDMSPGSTTPVPSGTTPAPSPVVSTDASPTVSTDASPTMSTDASPNLSTDASAHLPTEAPPIPKRNGSRPLADMFRTLGGGGANPMK